MFFNQYVARLLAPVPPRLAGRTALGLAVLALGSGCQTLAVDAPVAREASPPSAAAAQPAASMTSAIDAALARGEAGTATLPEAASPQQDILAANAPARYTVKRGDTLWGISAMFLRDPWLWPEIWQANPQVQNPHLIYPGDEVTLAYGANGEPRLHVTRGGDALRVSPLVRSQGLDGPIASLPYEAIAAFLGRPGIVSRSDLKNAPRVVALHDAHVVAGAGQDVYVSGLDRAGAGRYNIMRIGDPLRNPENGKVLGYMAVFTAAANVDAPGRLSKAHLVESARETVAGDLLFTPETRPATDLVPRAPSHAVDGQIMAVVDGVQLIGPYQVVAVNRGARHGLEAGHVLAIDERGETVPDSSCRNTLLKGCARRKVELPSVRAGTLLVFKTYDSMSYGLVVDTTRPVRVADHIRAP